MATPNNQARHLLKNIGASLASLLLVDLACMACGEPVPIEHNNGRGKEPCGTAFSNPLCATCAKELSPLLLGYCRFCGLPFPQGAMGHGPCRECAQQKPIWQDIYFIAAYNSLLQKLIVDLKFNSALYVAPLLGKILAQRILDQTAMPVVPMDTGSAKNSFTFKHPASNKQNVPAFSCIVPVPLFKNRLRKRGYNQSLEIAKAVGQNLKLPVRDNLLFRTKSSIPQEHLSRAERLKAVRGAFETKESLWVEHILLIDDVMTTGATATECAKTLLGSGVKNVSVAVAARTGYD